MPDFSTIGQLVPEYIPPPRTQVQALRKLQQLATQYIGQEFTEKTPQELAAVIVKVAIELRFTTADEKSVEEFKDFALDILKIDTVPLRELLQTTDPVALLESRNPQV